IEARQRAGQRVADEERLLLPMSPHERGSRQATEESQWSIGIHAALCDHRSMEIVAPCVVSLTWRLADAQGGEIDELREPVEFFFGGDDLLEKVEEALAGHEAGYETTLHLEPEHA